MLSELDLSDEDESWDSELDGPGTSISDSDSSDGDGRHQHHRPRSHRHDAIVDEMDEFERDPWNAVCVVGLRVFSQDTHVSIEVRHAEDDEMQGAKASSKAEGESLEVDGAVTAIAFGKSKQAELDVDDSAADATSPLRTRGNLEACLRDREKVGVSAIETIGSEPAGVEKHRSG